MAIALLPFCKDMSPCLTFAEIFKYPIGPLLVGIPVRESLFPSYDDDERIRLWRDDPALPLTLQSGCECRPVECRPGLSQNPSSKQFSLPRQHDINSRSGIEKSRRSKNFTPMLILRLNM
jgi:hypothetical protein